MKVVGGGLSRIWHFRPPHESLQLLHMPGVGTHSEDYQAFLAEGSGNVAADGYFNVSVLIECLRRKRIHCICQRNVGDHEVPGTDFGYILNHADHWLALRRVHGTW